MRVIWNLWQTGWLPPGWQTGWLPPGWQPVPVIPCIANTSLPVDRLALLSSTYSKLWASNN